MKDINGKEIQLNDILKRNHLTDSDGEITDYFHMKVIAVCAGALKVRPITASAGEELECAAPFYTDQRRIDLHKFEVVDKVTKRKSNSANKKAQPIKHGTLTAYQKGCRCDKCREAQNAYTRKRKAMRRRKRYVNIEWT